MDNLESKVDSICWLKGEFTLRSGAFSNRYFDKYLFESDPQLLHAITDSLVALIPSDTAVLAGLEMGGLPIATSLSLKTGLPVVFVRKNAKNYGTCKQIEGLPIINKKVLVVEDVISSGGAVKKAILTLGENGAQVIATLAVLNRSVENLKVIGGKPIYRAPLESPSDSGFKNELRARRKFENLAG